MPWVNITLVSANIAVMKRRLKVYVCALMMAFINYVWSLYFVTHFYCNDPSTNSVISYCAHSSVSFLKLCVKSLVCTLEPILVSTILQPTLMATAWPSASIPELPGGVPEIFHPFSRSPDIMTAAGEIQQFLPNPILSCWVEVSKKVKRMSLIQCIVWPRQEQLTAWNMI